VHRFDAIEPWSFPPRVEIPKFENWFDCRDSNILWSLRPNTGHELLRVTLPTADVLALGGTFHNISDCRSNSAVLISRSAFDQYLLLCRDAECKKVHEAPHHFQSAAALLDDGTWLFAAANGPVVGVWREKQSEPAFYRLHQEGELKHISVLKGKPFLVLVIDGVYQLVALP
jgi:hypothetical protein